MHPLIMKNQEQYVRFNRMVSQISRRLLGNLSKHEDTKKIDPNSPEFRFNEVIDYVIYATQMSEIKDVGIYLTTTKAIKSLNKIVNEEIKKELAKEKETDKEFAIALTMQMNSYLGAYGFFSTITKDIFIVKDAHLQRHKKVEKKEEIKPKKSAKKTSAKVKKVEPKETWKKEYGYKPARISHREWLRIHSRATLAHELFHYYMDVKTNTSSMILQEEFAYSNMIGWYRKEGLKDNEIIQASLMWWGRTIAVSKDLSLQLKGRRKELDKKAVEEAKKLIASYDIMCKTRDEARKYQDERKKDLEDGYFLELV